MKQLLLRLACILVIFISCTEQNSNNLSNKENTVSITGTIKNYNTSKWPDEGVYVVSNYLSGERSEYKFPIDSLGRYNLEFELDYDTDIYLYNGRSLNLLVQPGNQFSIQLDTNDSVPNVLDNIRFEGDNELANTQFLAYQNEQPKNWEEYRNRITQDQDDPLAFKAYLDSLSQVKENSIDNYLYDQKTEPLLKKWLAAQKIITSKKDLLRYEMMYGMYLQKQVQLPDNFYENIEPIGKITKEMLVNTNLTSDFGAEYSRYIDKMALKKVNNPKITWKEIYPIYNEEIISRNKDNNLFVQLMMNYRANAGFEQNNLDYYESIVPIKDSIFSDSKMGVSLEKHYTVIKDLMENPILPEKAEILSFASNSSSDYLQEIIDNANGKVVYIDNWATWCAPCRAEFKSSTPALKKEFGSDVEFVYLCHQSEEKGWKPMIAQYQIEGKHYFIERENSKKIKEQINLQGFPTYTIINKEGEIVKSGSEFRPSEAITTKILKELIAE